MATRRATTAPPRPGRAARLAAWWGGRTLGQLGLLAGVALIFAGFGANTVATMDRLGLQPGFAFLGHAANFEIGETVIPYKASDSYGHAIAAGLLNTARVVVVGCVLATVLGVLLGIARLSGNLLLAGLVRLYVEMVRNTPLLLQLFVWSAVTHAFPPVRQAPEAFGAIFLSNRGIYLPAPFIQGGTEAGWAAAVLIATAALVVTIRVKGGVRRLAVAILALTGILLALIATGASIGLELPSRSTFNIVGGLMLSPEFAALLIGLVVNTAATIAEIVRAGIESVPAGQWDAGRALGFRRPRIFRLIVLPQALRVITPLMTSSYLDLTKNSSLAVAIGFPDLVSILNTTTNTTGQALETTALMVAVFLAINLSVSAVMNLYNRRVALRGAMRR